MYPKKIIPTEKDWSTGLYDLDVKYAYKNIFGKTIEEAIPYIRRNPIERADELLFSPIKVFQYYIFSYIAYINEIDLDNLQGDINNPYNMACDGASCFLGLIKGRLEKDPESISTIMEEVFPTIEYIATNQQKFDADIEIYGDFLAKKMRYYIFIKELNAMLSLIPNFRFNCDKHPADYCVIFYGSEVISVLNFVVGCCRLAR